MKYIIQAVLLIGFVSMSFLSAVNESAVKGLTDDHIVGGFEMLWGKGFEEVISTKEALSAFVGRLERIIDGKDLLNVPLEEGRREGSQVFIEEIDDDRLDFFHFVREKFDALFEKKHPRIEEID